MAKQFACVKFLEVSAKTGDHVDALFEDIALRMISGGDNDGL